MAGRLIETYGGAHPIPADAKPSQRVSHEALLAAGFEPQDELDKLHTDLCRVLPPGRGTALPLVSPSVEQFAAVMGWRLEERVPVAREDEEGGGAEGAGAGAGAGATAPPPPEFSPVRDRNTYAPYRWMFSTLHDRASAHSLRLEEMSTALAIGSGVAVEDMTIGRIVPEADAVRVNTASVSLELPRGTSEGVGGGGTGRLVLDLKEMPRFAVFPGQVVGVQGAVTGGDKLLVTRLITNGTAPYARAPAATIAALASVRGGGSIGGSGAPVRVWVAAGPFTDPKDLAFEPLQEFLAEATQVGRPDVIVLVGPFVDADHALIRSTTTEIPTEAGGVAPVAYHDVWAQLLVPIIELYLGQAGAERIELVVQPSPADVHLEPIFPQWPQPRSDFDALESDSVSSRITLLPNPATWVCGDLVWGGTSVDTVFHLNGEEAARTPAGEAKPDRFTSLATHLLEQRSYYPLYPGASPEAGSGAAGVPLEVPQLWHVGMPCSPDILLLPSRLGRPTVRICGPSTLTINPGALARNRSYAKVAIHPHAPRIVAAALAAPVGELVPNDAPSRVRVDIERLTTGE